MSLPTQTQLLLPLLEALSESGGAARPAAIYDNIAQKLDLPPEIREQTKTCNGRTINTFERRVRWTRQTAVLRGLIDKSERSVWSLTQSANAKLGNIIRGSVVTFAISDRGAFLWASAEDAVAVIEEGSVDLLMTSPPYALINPKEYGNEQPEKWVDWMLTLCNQWCRLLTPTGSMMLNIGPCWRKGEPAQELHVERLLVRLEDCLGIHLLERLDWTSPTKLPTPLNWVAAKRLRVTPSVEPILWISPNPHAYGNNRNVLREYSPEGLKAISSPRLAKRPSGIQFGPGSFKDCGGSIPQSLITAVPSGREEVQYRKAMRSLGKEPHPAILPAAVARFGIQLATEPDDLVYDPFSGSGTIPIEAMKLGRRAIGSERSLAYLEGGMIRAELGQVPVQLAA